MIGIGLGGDEVNYPPELFARRVRDRARRAACTASRTPAKRPAPASVRNAVDVLGAERIGHGVRAIEDPAVVALLAERRIPLEICPTSNRLTGAAPAGAPHPLGALDRAGCVVTIDADDPAMFGTTLLEEYRFVAATAGEDTIVRFARNAIDASFASAAVKERLHASFDRVAGVAPEGGTQRLARTS